MPSLALVSSFGRAGAGFLQQLRSGLMPRLASVYLGGRARTGSLEQTGARSNTQTGLSFLILQGWGRVFTAN